MKISEAIAHYGSQAQLARAIGVTRQAVHAWLLAGAIPELQQYKLESLTGRRLRADCDQASP
jgi:hypothetical protein